MTARHRIALATVALLLAAPALLPAQDNPQSADTSGRSSYGGQRGQGRNGMGRGIRGKVIASNASSVTVKTEQGESWTVITTDNTRINIDRQPVKAADVKPGDEVMAMGIVDQDKHEIHAMMLGGISAAQAAKLKADLGKTYIVGKVTAINDTKLSIERPDHVAQTITLDETTSLKRGGRPSMEGMGGMGMLFGGGGPRSGAPGARGERPANENNANSGGMAPGAEGESITLADVKVGDNIAGTGSVKNGSFVPTDLHVLVRPQRGPRPDGAAPGNAPNQP